MWQFKTTFTWQPESGEQGAADAGHGAPVLAITPPADLGGKDGHWTPEDLLVSAVESCLMMTTMSVTKKHHVDVKSYRSEATGRMEKTPDGLRITGIDIRITATVGQADEVAKFLRAVSTAERYCPVSAAVKCPVHVEAHASVADA